MTHLDLELRKNIAENGRWFCAGLIAINLLTGSPLLAFLAMLAFAGAILSDLILLSDHDPAWISLAVYVFTAFVALATFINLW